ncbi:TPA: hypothetical protein N0F65_003129 [Lagenidium giganteum]|uniref:C2 domain-containing protein n=1 Tax=Lagenidium giganteum TaxID=4803 RepID=A0AAV2YXL7_9STRA|nr:TPA: hypothetical protein N0F65_003129 [Lagenidium giganteum]
MEHVVVGIVEARNVLVGDINGFSDPFVVMTLLDGKGNEIPSAGKFKTKIVMKTLNPLWNERFQIGDRFDLRLATTLRFMIYDFDGLLRDDTLGVVDIPLDMVTGDNLTDFLDNWFRISKVEGKMKTDARGELHLTFSRPGVLQSITAPSSNSKSQEPNLLYVTIQSGKDLLAMNPGNSSDPLVKLGLMGQKAQTSTVEKTLKPHWDERFPFVLTNPDNTLELIVEDEDPTINDFIGRAQIALADVLEKDVEKKVEVKLLCKKGGSDKDRGTLQISLLWKYDPNAESIAAVKRKKKRPSLLMTKLKSTLNLGNPDDAAAAAADAEDVLPESDEDAARPPPPPGADLLKFFVATIYFAEELPPLDVVLGLEKQAKKKHHGGGIDAYVGAWFGDQQDKFVRTSIRTKKGQRNELNPIFNESLMLFVDGDVKAETPATFAVMDWDQVGDDDVVGHFELRDVDALVQARGSKPFWMNLYGAPVRGAANREIENIMNENPGQGSTYRGRVLMKLSMKERLSSAYDAKNQKRRTAPLAQALLPSTHVYRLRAHFVAAAGLPLDDHLLHIVVTCGLQEIYSSRKKPKNGVIEWNESDESDKMLFPVDLDQIPDVFVYLCKGDDDERRAICYQRFTARSLVEEKFQREAEWITLRADEALDAVSTHVFPGAVLLRMGFSTVDASTENPWDQQAMMKAITYRAPFQVRVRVYEAKDLVSDAEVINASVLVSHVGQDRSTDIKRNTAAPAWDEALCFDVLLAVDRAYACPVLFHLQNHREGVGVEYLGSALLPLDADDGVMACAASYLKSSDYNGAVAPTWVNVEYADVAGGKQVKGALLVSVEIVRKTFPDEALPLPEPIVRSAP